MGSSKIEDLIEQIYEFVEGCKMQPLSSTKVIVPKDELYDLLDELRLRTPDEVKKFQKIIANRDAILSDAENKANAMLEDAKVQKEQMISEHEIMTSAYTRADDVINQATAQAKQIVDDASQQADEIRSGAMNYTKDMLASLESVLKNAVADSQNYYGGLIQALQTNLDTVQGNQHELAGEMNPNLDPVEEIMNGNDAAAAAVPDNSTDAAGNFDFDDESK